MTTTTAWAHLPNAKHIDTVLADVRARPRVWENALDVALGKAQVMPKRTLWGKMTHAVRACWRRSSANNVRIWCDSRCKIWRVASLTPQFSLLHIVRKDVDKVARGAAWGAAWDAILTLVVWPSSADLLDLPPDVLRTMADLAPEPICHQATLLLPWALVREAGK